MRTPLLAAAIAGVLLLSGCAATDASGSGSPASDAAAAAATTPGASGICDGGAEVVVQFGVLGGHDLDECAPIGETTSAAAVLKSLGITTAGTKQYGDQVVCRVDDQPSAKTPFVVAGHDPYTEKCATMSPAWAYWALWEKSSPKAEWSYAEEGINTLQVEPGQVLGLKFTTGADTAPPRG